MTDLKRTPWWVWVACLGVFGFGSWATIVPSLQRRKPVWLASSLLSVACFLVAFVLASIHDGDDLSGILAIVSWIGAATTALSIRGPYLQGSDPAGWESSKAEAATRLRERREAIALVASDPALAAELGVGRPDVSGARHAGVVDVNHADDAAIATLPGVDAALARRIVGLREDVNGFATLADLGSVADLDGNLVERLRERAVFLPR